MEALSSDMSENDNTQTNAPSSISDLPSHRQTYAQELRDGPTSALEHLRLLWNQRPSGILSPDCELLEDLSVLAERFVNPNELDNPDWRGIVRDIDELGADLWTACVQCNVISLLADMTVLGGLENQPRSLFTGVLACMTGLLAMWANERESGPSVSSHIVNTLPPTSQYNYFLLQLKDICSSLWNARHHILMGALNSLEGKLLSLQLLALAVDDLLLGKGTAWRPRKLAHIAIYAWINSPASPDFKGASDVAYHAHMAISVFISVYFAVSARKGSDSAALLVVDVLQQLGAERIISRTNEVLDAWQPSDLTPSPQGELAETLFFSEILISPNTRIPAVWDTYCREPTLEKAAGALSRSYMSPSKGWDVELKNWSYGSSHLRIAIEGILQHELPAEKVSAQAILLILSLGVRVALGAMLADTPKRSLTKIDTFKTRFEPAMMTMTHCVVCCLSGNGGLPLPLVEELRSAAGEIWYPVLRRVRDARIVCGAHPLYDLVESLWAEFGYAFGLDELSERVRFESMRTRMCSWEACEFNASPSSRTLLICKGCKEARYCSSTCQKSDWKEGGHRLRCRRLQQAGQN